MNALPIRYPLPPRALVLPSIDFICFTLTVLISWQISDALSITPPHSSIFWYTLAAVIAFWTIGTYLIDGYNPIRIGTRGFHVEVVSKLGFAFLCAFLVLTVFNQSPNISEGFLLLCAVTVPVVMLIGRFLGINVLHMPQYHRNVVVIGAGYAGRTIVHEMKSRPAYGYRPVAFLDYDESKHGSPIEGIQVIGCHSQLLEVINTMRVDLIVPAITHGHGSELAETLFKAQRMGYPVVQMTELYEILTQRVPVEHLPKRWINEFIEYIRETHARKRIPSVFLSYAAGLILFLLTIPVFTVVTLLIYFIDGRPVFFIQDRIGKGEKTFRLYKFRTMRNPEDGEDEGSIGNSWVNRITKLGKVLRATRLDELPQLFNVIKGDINIVGPRPFIPSEVSILQNKVPYYQLRFLIKPGITGHAQLLAGYENNPQIALRKLEYELFYIKYMSIWFDLVIILRTFVAVLKRRGK